MNALKKNILILSPFFRPNIGGAENYLDDLCEYLRRKLYQVTVITYQPLTTKARGKLYEKNGTLEIYRVPWFGNNLFHKLEPYPILEFIYLTPGILAFSFIFMLARSGYFSVIHSNGMVAALVGKFLSRVFKKRLVVSTCAVYDFRPGSSLAKAVKLILLGSNGILALGGSSKRELVSIGLPSAKINTYNLWVDQKKYFPAPKEQAKKSLGLDGKFIVLFVGRFIKKKGIEVLLEVADKVDKRISFVFIGDDSPSGALVRKAANESKNIVMVKGIRAAQLIPYYQAADLLAVPSLYEEAFGKVIIEALSCGTPVIGSNKGEIPSVINHSVGRVVEPTVENFKREIENFYFNRQVLLDITADCRAYAQKHFSEKNIEIITNSYN